MVRVFEGAAVLLLLSFFLAYIIAPILPPIRRLIRVGERRRPISDGGAILILYIALLVPGLLLWRSSAPTVKHWIAVTAPTASHASATYEVHQAAACAAEAPAAHAAA